ncbi:MAG: FtsW/RodA/SpoVE family cell cycle protein [Rickettsiales bacterium]|jgi:cell division protein FtsW|nr:FtsW/RodA/SpoVE family cell cycle protein [Rickettsiales bacterium]
MKRSDRSLFTNWWFQIDWWILGLVFAFSFVGLLAGFHSLHVLDKIFLFYGVSLVIFLFVPMIGRKKTIIGLMWLLFAACMALFLLTYADPHRINNSLRWARIGGFSVMPADLMKPAFIVLTAWFITEVKRRAPDDWIGAAPLWKGGWWPAYLAAFMAILLSMFFHPDLGNMFMYISVFGTMLFWAGMRWRYVLAFVGAGAAAFLVSLTHSHFRMRIFGGSDGYQIGRSLDAIRNGGLWGRGDESFLFQNVPMANNDFVFAGLAEMWGAVACAALVGAMFVLFCLLFRRAVENKDEFSSLVIFGAALLFAIHVAMNILTALGGVMKGTTLPFISYGGSSLLAFSILFAIILSLIRQGKWCAT